MPSPIHRLLTALQRLALPIVTAESCTSGALASALTSRPTAPSILIGGVTSYSLLIKRTILGVPADILGEGGPGDVSRECAAAMAHGVLRHSGLLEPSEERDFKFGVLLERGQGIGVSTTGYLDKVPDGVDESRAGEVWVGAHWFFKGTEGKRVERIDVGHITASRHERHAEEQMDEQDANRDARRKAVVDKAVEILLEVVEGIEKGEKRQA